MDRLATFLSITGERLSIVTLLVVTAALPFVFMPGGKEAFRTPKQIVFHAGALVLIAALALWSVRDGWRSVFPAFPRRLTLLLALIVGWTAIATATSSNLLISLFALGHVLLSVAWLLGAWASGLRLGRVLLLPAVAGGVLSAALGVLQSLAIWSPVGLDASGRLAVVGLMGNPNDLAGLLAIAAVPTVLFAMGGSPAVRVACGIGLALLAWGIFVTESGSGAASLIACLTAMLLATARRGRIFGSVAAALLLALALALPLLLSERILTEKIVPSLEARFSEALMGRIVPYTTALVMIRNEPITGVGPGCFGWAYPAAQTVAFARNPDLEADLWRTGMFTEVHNDHLEIAAETGLPGALLEMATLAVFLLGFVGQRRPARGETPSVGRVGAWGLAAALLVQMTFNFPLQISGILAITLFLAGVFTAWQSR